MLHHCVAETRKAGISSSRRWRTLKTGESTSQRDDSVHLVLLRPPTPLGAGECSGLSSDRTFLSKATFFRKLSEAVRSTSERIERAQTRHKRGFDRRVFETNRGLKAGDHAYLDSRNTPAEDGRPLHLSGQRRSDYSPRRRWFARTHQFGSYSSRRFRYGAPPFGRSPENTPDGPSVGEDGLSEVPEVRGGREGEAVTPRRSGRLRDRAHDGGTRTAGRDPSPRGENSVADPSHEREWVIDKLLKRGSGTGLL